MAVIFKQNQYKMSSYDFKQVGILPLLKTFCFLEKKAAQFVSEGITEYRYEIVLKASDIFNILNAQRLFSVTKFQYFILYFCKLPCTLTKFYLNSKERLKFLLLKSYEHNQEQSHPNVQSC